jgi:hypothetical protein
MSNQTNNKLEDTEIAEILSGVVNGVQPTTHEISMASEIKEYRKASREPVYWQFKSVNGDWLGVGKSGAEQATGEGCEVRPLYAAPPLQAVTVPDGWQLVPIEITDEIAEAISKEARCCGGIALDVYEAMLNAAPQPPNNN